MSYQQEWLKTDKGRASHEASRKRYRATASGRAAERRAANALRQRNRDQATAIKLARGCADCGYSTRPEPLDFDHLPGCGKVKAVSHMISDGLSWPKIEQEIAKCDVVCANCHRIRTADRG